MFPLSFIYNVGASIVSAESVFSSFLFTNETIGTVTTTLLGFFVGGGFLVLAGFTIAKWIIDILP